jgi:hypothetical protein
MPSLKIGAIESDKPIRITFELAATVHRDLLAYAAAHAKENGQDKSDPEKLIGPMLARFMATDRGFVKARKRKSTPSNAQRASIDR